jgi:hypothetical protein
MVNRNILHKNQLFVGRDFGRERGTLRNSNRAIIALKRAVAICFSLNPLKSDSFREFLQAIKQLAEKGAQLGGGLRVF